VNVSLDAGETPAVPVFTLPYASRKRSTIKIASSPKTAGSNEKTQIQSGSHINEN
jgi:hypothetical protein